LGLLFNRCATVLAQWLHSAKVMLHRTIGVIPILLLLTNAAMAQAPRESGPSLQERARKLEPLIVKSAKRYGLDPRVLRIICYLESRFRIDAVSPKGARGPMQFIPETAKRFGLRNPHDPYEALDAAARYVHVLLRKFRGRIDLALAAYNAGEGTVESFQTGKPLVLAGGKVVNPRGLITGGIPPYRETRAYVKLAIALYLSGQVPNAGAASLSLRTKESTLFSSRNDALRARSSATEKSRSSFIEVQ
jgi:soluble lytic murein transglycosylase-like protein